MTTTEAGPHADVVKAVRDTIWPVAQIPGMTESFELLLEYGQPSSYGMPTRHGCCTPARGSRVARLLRVWPHGDHADLGSL